MRLSVEKEQHTFLPRISEGVLRIISIGDTTVTDPDSGPGAFLTPGYGMGKKSRSGSGMNIPDHNSESLETIFGVKNKFHVPVPYPYCYSEKLSQLPAFVCRPAGPRSGSCHPCYGWVAGRAPLSVVEMRYYSICCCCCCCENFHVMGKFSNSYYGLASLPFNHVLLRPQESRTYLFPSFSEFTSQQ